MNALVKTNSSAYAYWDLKKSRLSVGGLLLLANELMVLSETHKKNPGGLCLVGEQTDVNEKLVELANSFQGFDAFNVSSIEGIGSNVIWPEVHDKNYQYGTYYLLQRYFKETGAIPPISLKNSLLNEAKQFISSEIRPAECFTVHLKNNQNAPGCSNANFKVWKDFFEYCIEDYPVKFLLIGNEPLPIDIKNLDNVLVARDYGIDLVGELALIQCSDAFMGMATGPCNMALLTGKPCVVFKNPQHDKEEMDSELGENLRFNFCKKNQSLIREFETLELLKSEFHKIYIGL